MRMGINYINKKKVLLILICTVLGIIVAYQEMVYFKTRQVEYVPVVVLKEDVSVNTMLAKGHLEYINYPKAIINAEFVQSIEQGIGKYAHRDIKAGTPLFLSDASNNKAVVVSDGMVRVSFSTNLQDALAGDVNPGSIVNLGFVSRDGRDSRMLFQNVTLVKVTDKSGYDLRGGNDKKINAYGKQDTIPATATVILKPEEVILLKQCESLGRIFISGY